MKKIILVIICICMCGVVLAENTHTIIIELTEAQYKAAAYDCYSVEEWVKNAIENKARQQTDIIVLETTDKNPKKISKTEKENIVKNAVIKSAAVRQAEFEAEFK